MLALLGLTIVFPLVPVTWTDAVGTVNLGACVRVGGPNGTVVGTACCVGQRDGFAYMLTASQAVPKFEPRVYDFFTRDSQTKPARSLTQGEVVVRSPDSVIALVKLAIGAERVPVIRLASVGDRPRYYPFDAISVNSAAQTRPQARAETIIAKRAIRRPNTDVAFYWMSPEPPRAGQLGAPLIAANGRIIGVRSLAQEGQGTWTHLDEILYALHHNKYAWLCEN